MFNRHSIRLKDYDYTTPWWYFVTICTHQHSEIFGEVIKDQVVLSTIGEIAEKCWEEIPQHFINVELDYFIIMPNHLHGIIIINETKDRMGRDVKFNVPTENNFYSRMSPKKDSLSVIVRTYKAAVSRKCNLSKLSTPIWQSSFYDRIIRNEKELYQIRKYIDQNPMQWELEKIVPGNIDI